MAITHATDVRADLAQAILDQLNAGSGDPVIVIMTAASGVLVSQEVSFSRTGAVLTVESTNFTASGSGTAALFQARDSDGNMVFAGSVAASGGDFTIDNVSIASGQTGTIAFTYTAPL